MERHGGQSSNRRILQRRVWPLCEAEVLRPADVSRRVYVRRRRRRETGVRHWMACRGSLAEYSAFLVCALRQGYDVAVRRTISSAWHSGCTWIRCSEEVNDQSRPSPVLRRSTEKMPSRIRQGRGPSFLSYCSFSRQLEVCGSCSKSDVLHHPQPGTKLHPDKSRKQQLLQKMASHNWVVAVLDGTSNVTSGPRRQHWPLQTILRVCSSLTEQLKVR